MNDKSQVTVVVGTMIVGFISLMYLMYMLGFNGF